MGEHRALGQAGGAAGILQQGDVVGCHFRPFCRRGRALDEGFERDDAGIVGDRRLRRADLAPIVVLADDEAVDQALLQEFQRGRQQRGEVGGDQNARAGVGHLVRQRDLAVERRKVRDAAACLQRAEEIDGVIGRVAEEQRDGGVLAAAGAEERRRCALGHRGELGVGDRTVAEFQRRARAVIGSGFRQEVRQRALDDGVVPTHALGVKLFAGMGHFSSLLCDASSDSK